jgi:hypothetical protein
VGRICVSALVFVLLSCAASTKQYVVDYDKLSAEAKAYFGSTDNLSSRLFILSRYGLPFLTGDRYRSWAVFNVEDLFVRSGYPADEEIWTWEDCKVTFYSLATLDYCYLPPLIPPGQTRLELTDTCTQDNGDFVVEFEIDGLREEDHRTLYKIQMLARSDHGKKDWTYLYDTSPIVGRNGLRSVHFTARLNRALLHQLFPVKNKKEKRLVFLIVMWDFLSSEKREAVFGLSLNGRRG